MQNHQKRPATITITDRKYDMRFKDSSMDQLPLIPLEEDIVGDRLKIASQPQLKKFRAGSINFDSKKQKII